MRLKIFNTCCIKILNIAYLSGKDFNEEMRVAKITDFCGITQLIQNRMVCSAAYFGSVVEVIETVEPALELAGDSFIEAERSEAVERFVPGVGGSGFS